MCRLLGIIANETIDLKFSFLKADKPFRQLGLNNPDGWGIGWYINNKPEIEKEGKSILESGRDTSTIKEARSPIIISHVRNKGKNGAKPAKRNSHPFSFENFIFAHNGSVDRKHLINLLEDDYKSQLEGETDSEVYFYWLVQNIRKKGDVVYGIRSALEEVRKSNHTGLNFLLSNGNTLYAFRYSNGNRNYYSLFYIVRDPADKEEPLSLQSKETQMLLNTKSLNNEKAVLVCSEELTEEKWLQIPFGNILIIDRSLSPQLEQIIRIGC
jgi:glutamine amidotransferase